MPRNSNRDAVIARLVELLREERLRRNLSLNEVAARAGLSHTMVSRVEKRERTPTIETLLRITNVFDLPLSKLLAQAEAAAD